MTPEPTSTDGEQAQQRPIPAGWKTKQPAKRRGRCAISICSGNSEITVVAQATMRHGGKSKALEATSVALCNEHALELFAEIRIAVDARRSM